MKRLLTALAFVCLSLPAFAQNLTTVSGSNTEDLNGTKLAAGQVCFLGTDNSDNPISFQVGGGGQALRRRYCSPITAGVITSFTVPNPANTLPSGIYYRVTVKDSSTGVEVLRYTGVTFAGGTFNFDNYTPVLTGANLAPLTGNSVSGNLGVTGNITATGTVTGSNIPANIIQQIFSSGTGQTQRTGLNFMAGITCADNGGTSRTDCRLGTLTTVSFSATPTFDASTASSFKITLTANVTSSTLSNAVAGQPISFEICQDATGGRTFVPPANVLNMGTILGTANACSTQEFWFDGANAVSSGPMLSGGAVISGLVVNPSSLGSGAALTVGGTSTTTGGISVFVGALGAGSERLGVYPADAATAATRVGKLSARATSGGFLTGAEGASMDGPTGVVTGAIFKSTAANPSATGAVALATGDCVKFRNNANSADLNGFCKNTSDQVLLGSGPVIVPAAADTAALLAATQTLTNKNLGGSGSTTPFTNYNRMRANQGTALVAGDFAASAGWGTTATVGTVLGTDSLFSFTVTSNGTGQAANPTVTITFHDGTWTNSPICVVTNAGGTGASAPWLITAMSATAVTFTFNTGAAPGAGLTYVMNGACGGR